MNAADITGATGVFILLLAFILSGLNTIDGKGKLYYLLNAVGAFLAGYASYMIGYIPFILLEAAWTIVSLAGFVKSFK